MNDDSVVWDDIYSVGFEPIDNQHKELVKIINEIFESCKQGTADAGKAFYPAIKKAAEYATFHFADEDKYMVKANYPKINEQRQQHDAFLATVQKSIEEFKAGNSKPVEFARFLKKWLLTHIAESDKQYAPYMAKL